LGKKPTKLVNLLEDTWVRLLRLTW